MIRLGLPEYQIAAAPHVGDGGMLDEIRAVLPDQRRERN